MEDKRQGASDERPKHPKESGNFFQHLFFCWELPILVKGWKKELTEQDLYSPPKEHESVQLGNKLEQLWTNEEKLCKNPSLGKALIRQFGLELLLNGLVFVPAELVNFLLQPLFLKKLLEYHTAGQTEITSNQAYICAGIITLLSAIRVLFLNWMLLEMSALGMKTRIACSSLIYRRILKFEKIALQKVTVGKVINLLSNDVNRLERAFALVHFLWIAPIEIVLGVSYMNITLGPAAVAGVGAITFCLLFQIFMSKKLSINRNEVALSTDNRIRLINDAVCGIQAIKMYSWERPFLKLVNAARNLELKRIILSNCLRLANNAVRLYLTPLCIFFGVLAMVLRKLPLTSENVYSMKTIYDSLNLSVTFLLPLALIQLTEGIISVNRIEKFLLDDCEKPNNCKISSDSSAEETVGISIINASFKWDESLPVNVLNCITFSAKSGELIGVFGASGSGKSTLLQVILKEIGANGGHVSVKGSTSYAPQDPWIFSASIRQNILFGQDLDTDKYHKVIKCCALESDLSLLPNGDQSLVGERGVMLSGGQKARLSLARAIYRDADIYLLDDPLSALDANVARQIFEECVLHYLKDKCVVLVTHQIQYLRNVSKIYILEKGKIVECDKYERLLILKDEQISEDKINTFGLDLTQDNSPSQVKEHRSEGVSNTVLYKLYCNSAGHWLITCVTIFLFVLLQFLINFVDYFLTFWINLEQEAAPLTSTFTIFFTRKNCLYIYTSLLIALIVVTYIANISLVKLCTNASRVLHQSLLTQVIYQPMIFFNQHSSGRILNRFSNDIGLIDELMPLAIANVTTAFLSVMGTFILISVLNYWMILPSIVQIVIVYFLCVVFQPTNTNLRRTEAITRSSVFGHVTATMQGLSTIKAFGAQKVLSEEFDNHQNLHSSALYLSIASYCALGFWTDLMTVLYVGLVMFSFFFFASGASSSSVGLAITHCTGILGIFQYLVKLWGELETYITSVERVAEYTHLPLEEDGRTTPPKLWPTEGKIMFHSVSMQYCPTGPLALNQVSFQIRSGQKIGIVGRTGSGKTSLISALFRLFNFDGIITIDDVDIKNIPLNDLRSNISIIPQSPILFLGTLRKNLDPFDEFSDEQIWKVFDELELKEIFDNLPNGIDSPVCEGGSNFSVGQRQLLCLVRSMLRSNKIVVLDEATANVDFETDELIQSIIRRKFQESTVVTVAHRLNTVMDSDKILVMDNGCVAEFDSPYQLLQNPDGLLYLFAKESGEEVLQNFVKIAQRRNQTYS